MAGEGTGKKRRSAKYDQPPQRVENAAQAMQNTPNGLQRGYRPGDYTTARQPMYPPNAQGPVMAQPGRASYNDPGWPGNGTTSRQPGAAWQEPSVRQQTGQMTGKQLASTGAYRGFVMPPAPPAPQPKKKSRVLPAVLIIMLVLAIGAGGYFGVSKYLEDKKISDKVTPYDNLFCPGVYVDGIDLGGMTPEQAMNSVQSQIRRRNDAWAVNLMYQNETMASINAQMLGMSVDVGDVMNKAWLQGHTGTREERYQAMEALKQTPYEAFTAIPSGDTSVIDSLMQQIKASIDTPAQDAAMISFDTTQSYPFVFQDEVYGKTLDIAPIVEELYRKVALLESGTIELMPTAVEPAVKKSDLIRHYMLRSSVYTPIDKHSTEERNNNIRRAFEFINGYVLKAGDTFSFNKVVGERTEKNGFFPAIEYAYGEHVMGVGGGVCQASTTLYQAAVCAGLQIIKREPHSDSVSYTEYGKDATVYWGDRKKIDFSFRNNTDEPIYIVAAVEQDPTNKRRLIAKISMYGKDMGDIRYEIEAKEISTLDPPTEPKYIKDTEGTYVTYTDQQKSVSKPKEGHVVQSWRLEYTGNVLTGKTELYTDTYEAKPERIYVGVKSR